jgi:hypothetical protein
MAVLAPILTKGKLILAMIIKQLLLWLRRDLVKRSYNGCTWVRSDKRSNNLSLENQTIVVVVEKGSGEAQLQRLHLRPLDKRSNNLSHKNVTIVVVVEKGSFEAQLQWLRLHPL